MAEVVWAPWSDPETVARHILETIGATDPAILAVPGGKTPLPILERLAEVWPAGRRAEVWLTDERLAPQGHSASNYDMVRGALPDPAFDVRAPSLDAEPPRFDLVWVGMGADGHIASLFPRSATIAEGRKVVHVRPEPLPPEAPFERLSLTLPALTDAAAMMIVARGREKRTVLEAALNARSALPVAGLIAAAVCPVTIFWTEDTP